MRKLKDSIFREYDIRGIVGEDITIEDAELLGLAFGTYLKEKGEKDTVIGRDNRESSPIIRDHLIKGIIAAGINVIDIGVVVTPIFYYSTYLYSINSGMIITASHNPAEYNGFKVQYDGRTLYGEELREIKEIANKGFFSKGEGAVTHKSPVRAYREMLKEKIKLGAKKLKVVVDCGNGTGGFFAPTVYEDLGCEVIPIFCESDPSFPNHFPDPTKIKNLQDLVRTVKETGADLGIGVDGDGDRIGVVDEKGNIIWGDILMILFWREILPKHPGATAIIEVKCSDVLVKEIERLGGNHIFYKTGHSLIKAKMKEIGSVFTGEMSGHMFFADEYFGYDDAIYAGARLLRILSNSNKKLSELLEDIPAVFSTPEIRIACQEKEKASYVGQAKSYFNERKKNTIEVDGVRVLFNEGWGLVRASNTGPELIIRCEASTLNELEEIKMEISRSIAPLKIEF